MEENNKGEINTPRLIIKSGWKKAFDIEIREEIHRAGEFEFYFGIKETPKRLQEMSFNRKLFFTIYEKESNNFVGYIGFTCLGKEWEPEIYIFKTFRRKGYGTETLCMVVEKLFAGCLFTEKKGKSEYVSAEKLVATVRIENVASQRLMEKVGFCKTKNAAYSFMGYIDPEGGMCGGFLEVVEYTMLIPG